MDKRTYIQYYLSLLKIKHLIIFTFYTNNDYNPKIIKIILFLFSFALYYTANALFYNESAMHRIYEDNGSYNIDYRIPQILYSSIICSFINTFIKAISLTEKSILELIKDYTDEKFKNFKKCLLIKLILFFIINFLFLIIFWYYLSCFCAVYRNTQIYLIKDTLICFGLSLFYPIGLSLIPGMLRIPALNSKKKNKVWLFKISKFIQII